MHNPIHEGLSSQLNTYQKVSGKPESLGQSTEPGATQDCVYVIPERASNKYQILVAEDCVDNQKLFTFFLRAIGMECTCVDDGQRAVESYLDTPGHYDAILMDMQMPVLDGYEATRLLRRIGCQLPIIAVTAHAMDYDRQLCLDAGCTDYLTKPIDRKLFKQTLEKYLGCKNAPKLFSRKIRTREFV